MKQGHYQVITNASTPSVVECGTLDEAWVVANEIYDRTAVHCGVWEETPDYAAFRGSTRVGRCG